MTRTEANEPSRFSSGDSFITHRAYIAGRLKNGEVGQLVVPRVLNDTKKIRKAGADIFANVGAEQRGKNNNKFNFL